MVKSAYIDFERVVRPAAIPVCATALILAFILSSYPMMRPGIDIWVHLGLIQDFNKINPSAYPPSRVHWHEVWHHVLRQIGVSEIFASALVIHRIQFLAVYSLIASSSYILLDLLLRRVAVEKSTLYLASLLSSALWLCMTGTRSHAHDGFELVQSWMIWYSVNYQISLPLVIFAIAIALRLAFGGLTTLQTSVGGLLLLLSLGLVAAFHMAELAYFLLAVVALAVLFVRRRRSVILAIATGLVSCLLIYAALQYSHAHPRSLKYILSGEWGRLLDNILAEGQRLSETGATRMEFGWNALHTVSLSLILLGMFIQATFPECWQRTRQDWKVSAFVLSSALLPLALFTHLGTGIFAYLTYAAIAYRFAFANLLFIGIPFFILVVTYSPVSSRLRDAQRPALVALCAAFVLAIVGAEQLLQRRPVVTAYAFSLLGSLRQESMYFGVTDLQYTAIHQKLRSIKPEKPKKRPRLLCADIFTAYHLFFVQRFHRVALPRPLKRIPGYAGTPANCKFRRVPPQATQ